MSGFAERFGPDDSSGGDACEDTLARFRHELHACDGVYRTLKGGVATEYPELTLAYLKRVLENASDIECIARELQLDNPDLTEREITFNPVRRRIFDRLYSWAMPHKIKSF